MIPKTTDANRSPQKLTREPKTPSQRPLTLTSLSSSSHSKNPKNAGRTPGNSAGRLVKEPLQSTPHGAQAMQQLRAARQTPGKNRRRSGQIQRETPRGILRALSKGTSPELLLYALTFLTWSLQFWPLSRSPSNLLPDRTFAHRLHDLFIIRIMMTLMKMSLSPSQGFQCP